MTAGIHIAAATAAPIGAVEPLGDPVEVEPSFWTHLAGSPLLWAVVALALGLYLLLPRGTRRGNRIGSLALAAGLILLAWRVPAMLDWGSQTILALLAIATVLSSVAAITLKNPMYCALWFGVTLLGVAALYLYQGAEFLSVATITVYAGAILVTFLFVLMLAQPAGQAAYDRVSWEAALAAATGAILIGLVFSVVDVAFHPESPTTDPESVDVVAVAAEGEAFLLVEPVLDRSRGVLADEHVVSLGRELLGRHLISMQIAAALMLAALVGAVAVVAQGKKIREQQAPNA